MRLFLLVIFTESYVEVVHVTMSAPIRVANFVGGRGGGGWIYYTL